MSLDNIMTKADLDDYTTEIKEYVGGGIRNVYKSIGSNGAKNLLHMTLANIKANNTSGTWNDNKYTIAGVTFTVNTDNNGNVLSITADGTANAAALLILKIGDYININTQYILSGCPNGGGDNKYRQYVYDLHAYNKDDNGDGVVFSYNGNYLSNLVWRIAIYNGYTANNLTFYPMIRLASDTDLTFQPYAKTNLELTNQVDSITDVTEVNDNSPYLYKASSHNAVYDKLVGASFGWNQLVQNGNFAESGGFGVDGGTTSMSNNVCTVTVTSLRVGQGIYTGNNPYPSVVNGHKYLISYEGKFPRVNTKCGAHIGGMTSYPEITSGTANTWGKYQFIINYNKTTGNYAIESDIDTAASGYEVNDTYQLRNFYCIDLTLMFGPTIADYVYSLEQATTGSGIAWLKSYGFFTKDYYPYNAGELQSVKTSGKKVVGKNLWGGLPLAQSLDSNSETHVLDTTNKTIAFNHYRNSNVELFSNFKPNTQYSLIVSVASAAARNTSLLFLYEDGTESLAIDVSSAGKSVKVSYEGKTLKAIVLAWQNGGLVTLNYEECGLFEGIKTVSDFEPYASITYPLGNDELRGIPKLVNNQLVYDGDIKTSDGAISRRYIESVLPTSNWIINSNSSINLILQNAAPNSISVDNSDAISRIICSHHLVGYSANYLVNNMLLGDVCDSIAIISNNRFLVVVPKSKYATVADFESYLANNNVRVVYELATPTTEASTPFISPQMVYSNGTEEYIDTRDVPIPVGGDREYIDIPEWMDNKYFNDLRANIMLNYAESQSF